MAALALVPLEVLARAAGRLEVDLLVSVVTDVADQCVPGLAVDAETERIAEAPVEDFGAFLQVRVGVDERIAGQDRVGSR